MLKPLFLDKFGLCITLGMARSIVMGIIDFDQALYCGKTIIGVLLFEPANIGEFADFASKPENQQLNMWILVAAVDVTSMAAITVVINTPNYGKARYVGI